MKATPQTIPGIVAFIKRHEPTTPEEFLKLGLTLEWVGEGCFRTAYRIKDSMVLVKFPIDREGKIHSTTEVKRIKRLKKYPELSRHVPEVLYHNRKTGILLMRYYELHGPTTRDLLPILTRLIRAHTGMRLTDISNDNVGMAGKTFKFIDLGY